MKNKIVNLILEYRYYNRNYLKLLKESNYFSYDLNERQKTKFINSLVEMNYNYCYGDKSLLKEGVATKVGEELWHLFGFGEKVAETGKAVKEAGVLEKGAAAAAKGAEASKGLGKVFDQAFGDVEMIALQRAREGLSGEELKKAILDDLKNNEIFTSKDEAVRRIGADFDKWAQPIINRAEETAREMGRVSVPEVKPEISPETPSELPAKPKVPDLAPEEAPPTVTPETPVPETPTPTPSPEIVPPRPPSETGRKLPSEFPADGGESSAGTGARDEIADVGTIAAKRERPVETPRTSPRAEPEKIKPKKFTKTGEEPRPSRPPAISGSETKFVPLDVQGKPELGRVDLQASNLGQSSVLYRIK